MSDEPVILLIQTVALIVATVLRVLLFILTLPFRIAAMIWAAIRRHRPKTRDNELLIEEAMARGLPKALAVPAVRRAASDGSRHDRLWATKALDQALAEVLRDQYSPETRGQLRQVIDDETRARGFELGEQVLVLSGPFADFNGAITEIDTDHSKLKILVNIYERETPVELYFDDVAKF